LFDKQIAKMKLWDGYAALPPRRSLYFSKWRTESQRLSAREAAKPQSDLIAGKGTRELLENAKGAELRKDFS